VITTTLRKPTTIRSALSEFGSEICSICDRVHVLFIWNDKPTAPWQAKCKNLAPT